MSYIPVTINSSQVPADLTDYIVFVNLGDLPTTAFWNNVSAGGGDIRIFKNDGTTELAREVVSCDKTTETGELYFKYTGTLSSSSDTTFRIYFDGVSADYATTATYGRNNVWTIYSGVYHMNHHSTITNSTGGTNGTGVNTVAGDIVDGYFGKAIELLTNGDYLALPTGQLDTYSIQFLYKKNGNTSSQNAGIERWTGVGTSTRLQDLRINTGGTWGLESRNGTGAQNVSLNTTSTTTGNNNWHWLAATLTSGSQKVYFDGVDETTTTTTHGANTLTTDFWVNKTYDATARYANATYDEVRITSTVLSPDWYETEYNNQSNTSTFYTVGGLTLELSIVENLSLNESIATFLAFAANVSDSVSVSDVLTVQPLQFEVSLSELLTITENTARFFAYEAFLYEQIAITEETNRDIVLVATVHDDITISEYTYTYRYRSVVILSRQLPQDRAKGTALRFEMKRGGSM